MNCFNHANQSACSQCAICHKGLCQTCNTVFSHLCICSEPYCAHIAKTQEKIYAQFNTSQVKINIILILYLISGVSFVFAGIYSFIKYPFNSFDFLIILIGLIFIVNGVIKINFRKNKE